MRWRTWLRLNHSPLQVVTLPFAVRFIVMNSAVVLDELGGMLQYGGYVLVGIIVW